MALEIDLAECIGCGACESACPAEAVTQSEDFPVTYRVDPLRCNDCERCRSLCPVDGFTVAEGWAICHGRGCPLSSRRYAGVECSEGQSTCPSCGSVLWRRPGEDRGVLLPDAPRGVEQRASRPRPERGTGRRRSAVDALRESIGIESQQRDC